jgi:5-methyltetrahydropteroyltriglutamate--homocysteine methyltransferase
MTHHGDSPVWPQDDAGDAGAQVIAARFHGGSLDCGNGLLLLIRKHIDPLRPGELLEVTSSELSVREDLPAWCRMTKNELLHHEAAGADCRFVIRKSAPHSASRSGDLPADHTTAPAERSRGQTAVPRNALSEPTPTKSAADELPPLACMGIGSWPRPRWLLRALHDHLEGRLGDDDFREAAEDAVRLAVTAQQRAEVDVLTDGEQHRDDYASFVAMRLGNCQLIPVSDLLPYLDEPEAFARSLAALDVPADKIRFPAVTGPLYRRRPLALDDYLFLRTIADRPCKVALPGPYLLTRTMWMECISDRAYPSREALATDLVRILREEITELLQAGVHLIQLDEPVLTEVVHGRSAPGNRSFMCGALGQKGPVLEELDFAQRLLAQVTRGFPRERLALHVCRGNWTPDESAALAGDYHPLLPLLKSLEVGTVLLEMCTPRAGELSALTSLPTHFRLGIGVVNQKTPRVESVAEVLERGRAAIELFGRDRVLLTPDCGFATFADNPVASTELAAGKLTALAAACRQLRLHH